MPSINGQAQDTAYDIALSVLNMKVGEVLELNFKSGKIVLKRLECSVPDSTIHLISSQPKIKTAQKRHLKNVEGYKKKIEECYKEGIMEDLKSGRHISAIICGYGATYCQDYLDFVEALKSFDWFNKLYSLENNGRIK